MNVNKLKGKIVENGMTIEEVAGLIGLDRATLYRKLANFEKITIGDAIKIKQALNLSNEDSFDIFLA